MKKILSVTAAVAVAGVFTLASCGSKSKTTTTAETTTVVPATTTEIPTSTEESEKLAAGILQNYIFENANAIITADFELPSVMTYKGVDYAMEWTSDSSYAVIGAADADTSLCPVTVTRPEEDQTITLTVKLIVAENDTAEASYTIYINAIDAYEISNNFAFEQKNATVYSDFELPATTTYLGKTASITWEVVAARGSTVEESPLAIDGNTCKVTPCDEKTAASLKATISYNGVEVPTTFKLTVYHERTAVELLHAFYDDPGAETFTFRGYVIAKAGYAADYGDGYLFVEDESLQGGYYIYYAYIDQDGWDSLQPGTRVEIPGCTSTTYNGLIETTNSKDKQVTIIEDDDVLAPLTTEQLKIITEGVAIDNKLYADDDTLKYQTGTRVTLTGWTVKAVTALTATKGGTALTLVKGDKEVTVQVTKYGMDLTTAAEGAAATTADKTVAALNACKVGDIVNVSGLLNNYKGWYILACDENIVSAGTADDNASIADGKALVDALDAITFEKSYVDDATVSVAIPEGMTGTVSVAKIVNKKAVATENAVYDAEAGTVKLTPTATEETVQVTVTLTKNGITSTKTYETTLRRLNADEQEKAEADAFDLEITAPGTYTLPSAGETYTGVAITYEWDANDAVTIADGKMTIRSVDETTTVTGKVTFTMEGAEAAVVKTVSYTVVNPVVNKYTLVTSPESGKSYKFVFNNPKANGYYMFAGEVTNTKYLTTTQDVAAGTDVLVTKNEDNTYTLSFKDASGATKYIALNGIAATISDTAFNWTFNTTYYTFTANVSGTDYYIGTYSTYTTFSASKLSYAATSYPGGLYTVDALQYTRAEKVAYEKEKLAVADGKSGTTVTLPTASLFDDVTITYAVAEADAAKGTVTEDGLVVSTITDNTTLTLTATIECGGITDTKEITIKLAPVSYSTVAEICALDTTCTDTIFVKGIVTKVSGTNIYLSDGTNEFEAYGVSDSTVVAAADVTVGNVLYLYGSASYYANASLWETAKNTAVLVKQEAATDDEKITFTKNELAAALSYDTDGEYQLASAGTVFTTAEIAWSKDGATLTDNKLTVTQTSEDQTFTLVATITCGDGTAQTKNVTVTVKKESNTKTVTMGSAATYTQYKVTVTDDVATTITENLASVYGLDSTIFTVTLSTGDTDSVKEKDDLIGAVGSAYACALYGDSTKDGNHLYISVASGYTIDSIVITYNTGKTGGQLSVNEGTALTAISTSHTTDTVEFTDTTKVDIHNVTASQIRIQSIAITYTKTVTE